tara:strand:+ start:2719 stop:2841 length:123 start_codon:yes stop_codon:yes gene_type:complete
MALNELKIFQFLKKWLFSIKINFICKEKTMDLVTAKTIYN